MNDLAKQAIATLVTIVISMGGFWLMIGRQLPTRAEVDIMIEDKFNSKISPLTTEIRSLSDKLDYKMQVEQKLMSVVENNTKVISRLEIAIAVLENEISKRELRNNDIN